MSPLRQSITGSYDRAALAELSWPVAWSGTVSGEERARQESDLRALVVEALEALDGCPDAESVEIVAGEIVATVVRT